MLNTLNKMSRTLSNALQNAFRNPGKSVTFNGTAKLRLINGQQLVSVKSPSFMAIHNDKLTIEICKWLGDNFRIYPRQDNINNICENGNLKLLKFLYENFRRHPDQIGSNQASFYGHTEVVEWLETEFKIYPETFELKFN